ncbi:peptidoglycan-binding domain-containing protein [Luteipulveratus mongoliensis]|uniref:peptidoglycan-binding domain-containing protein n=1 Tax=Luteipulveratus mongoliensis TaxID=571913 RepID=UPI001470696F|nr:peptidoglycan-binding domain-containing protein [Luteipulveratus mongoliensis]
MIVATIGIVAYTRLAAPRAAADSAPAAAQTTEVTRTDLSDTQQFPGSLGYGLARDLKGRKAGTLTWLPASGTSVDRGAPLYKVNNQPVVLFFGSIPMYRKLEAQPGHQPMEGPDVRVIIDNLAALGYGTKGDHFTEATAASVKRWQHQLGLPETGAIDPADVVVQPGKVRVESVGASVGDSANGPLMSVTGTVKSVTMAVDLFQASLVKPGTKVTVTLPNGTTTAGTVREINRNAASDKGSSGSPDQQAPVKVQAIVTLGKPGEAKDLDSAPVQVSVTTETKRGVLAVPIGALLALRDGGYGIEIQQGGATHLLAIQTGLFAKGMVEISGKGVAAGQRVEVTS